MITSYDLNPKRQLYYIGSLILSGFNKEKLELDFFKLYSKLKNEYNVSMNLFVFSLDLLFLIGLIRIKDGKIIRCS